MVPPERCRRLGVRRSHELIGISRFVAAIFVVAAAPMPILSSHHCLQRERGIPTVSIRVGGETKAQNPSGSRLQGGGPCFIYVSGRGPRPSLDSHRMFFKVRCCPAAIGGWTVKTTGTVVNAGSR